MDSAWIQRPVKLIQSDSDGVIIIQTDSDKFQKNSDRFSLIQNFLFMRYVKYGENQPHCSEKKLFEFFQKFILYVDIATYQIKQFKQKSHKIMEGH